MYTECLDRDGAVLGGIDVGQASPRRKDAGFDGSQPRLTYGEPSAGMEVLHECCNAEEVVGC